MLTHLITGLPLPLPAMIYLFGVLLLVLVVGLRAATRKESFTTQPRAFYQSYLHDDEEIEYQARTRQRRAA